MQRLANLFCLDGDVEDDVNGEKDGTGDEVKQILEDGTTNDPKFKEDSITEDIDFSVLDRMTKFNPTKYGQDFIFAFPKFTCGDCSSGILLRQGILHLANPNRTVVGRGVHCVLCPACRA
jgi:hypothetical protein